MLRVWCYLITVSNNGYKKLTLKTAQELLNQLPARVIKAAYVLDPKHLHAVVCTMDRSGFLSFVRYLQAEGWYINIKHLPNPVARENAKKYVEKQGDIHASPVFELGGGSMSLEERVSRLEENVNKLVDLVNKLVGEGGSEKKEQEEGRKTEVNSNVKLKKGRKAYMLIAKRYSTKYGSAIIYLSRDDLIALKAAIDDVLSESDSKTASGSSGKRKKSLKVEKGFKKAVRRD